MLSAGSNEPVSHVLPPPVFHESPDHESLPGSPGFGMLVDRADSLDSDALRHFVALYFTPPADADNEVIGGEDFYRLELGENYVKLIRQEAKPS